MSLQILPVVGGIPAGPELLVIALLFMFFIVPLAAIGIVGYLFLRHSRQNASKRTASFERENETLQRENTALKRENATLKRELEELRDPADRKDDP